MQQTTNNKQYLLMWIVDRRGSITNIITFRSTRYKSRSWQKRTKPSPVVNTHDWDKKSEKYCV
ncbi:MAG: hypothetical protein ACI8RD_000267 [Bacillariaceae sp.]|jgi:hypothetical protein